MSLFLACPLNPEFFSAFLQQVIGEDGYDYPLTWRAMERGFEVRHVLGPDPWPCVLVSDRGGPPEGTAARGGPWWPVLELYSQRGGANVMTGGVWFRR